MREDRDNRMEQRVIIRVEGFFAHDAHACDCALYIC